MKKKILVSVSIIFAVFFLSIFILAFIKMYPIYTKYDRILLYKTGGIAGVHSYYRFDRYGVLCFVTERNPMNRFEYKTKMVSPLLYVWVSYKVSALNLESIDGYYNTSSISDGYHMGFELTRKDGRVINGYTYGISLPGEYDTSDIIFTLDHMEKRDLIRAKISRGFQIVKRGKIYRKIINCMNKISFNVKKILNSVGF